MVTSIAVFVSGILWKGGLGQNSSRLVMAETVQLLTSSLEAALLQKNANAIALLDAKVLLRKAPDWEYEREWRLISNVGLQESPLKLTEVTVGLRCANAVRHTLMRALDGRPDSVAFYEMRNIRGTFNLERVPVDSEDTCYLPRTAMSGIEAFGDPNES